MLCSSSIHSYQPNRAYYWTPTLLGLFQAWQNKKGNMWLLSIKNLEHSGRNRIQSLIKEGGFKKEDLTPFSVTHFCKSNLKKSFFFSLRRLAGSNIEKTALIIFFSFLVAVFIPLGILAVSDFTSYQPEQIDSSSHPLWLLQLSYLHWLLVLQAYRTIFRASCQH